ncbi:hypothetical protein GWK47_026707 [Chionoecetes opilio]|uniref:Uncharacterized protein n=1 Tax=Chionoecetes opilio TaxID=41210 RepID=A0A8J8WL26_CHIOP|nr:hypothetical protein GWK47_026707 [Chionoecetes opilio]
MFNLFDVAHADALKLIKNPEDRDFLLAQWELGRRGSVGSVELVLVRKEEAAQKKEANARQIERTRMEQEASCSQVELASSSLSPLTMRATLDRTKMSDRMAPYVLTEVAKSLGHDLVELNMSRSSVKCYRERYRAEKWADLNGRIQGDCGTMRVDPPPDQNSSVPPFSKAMEPSSTRRSSEQDGTRTRFAPFIEEEMKALLDFACSKLSTKSFKDDYREFLELGIIYLGGSVPGFSFKHPGAMHQAR